MMGRRRGLLAMLLAAGLAMAAGKPAWGGDMSGLHNVKSGDHMKPSGQNDIADQNIDFDNLSPRDCANYLCVSSADLASEYMESGCPGQFAKFESDPSVEGKLQPSFMSSTTDGSSGVSTGTLLSLAGASGIFAAGVGFLAGYKASPSFAYMRIPSLV